MLSDQLLNELSKLNRAEKLRVIQLLLDELSIEEGLQVGGSYEVWSPYDAFEAANILQSIIAKYKGRA